MRIQSLNQSFKLASAVLAKITQRFIPLTRGNELNGSLTKYRVPRTPQSKIKDLTPITALTFITPPLLKPLPGSKKRPRLIRFNAIRTTPL